VCNWVPALALSTANDLARALAVVGAGTWLRYCATSLATCPMIPTIADGNPVNVGATCEAKHPAIAASCAVVGVGLVPLVAMHPG
jgi:hypothetical protein